MLSQNRIQELAQMPDEARANDLVHKLKSYWRSRGYEIEARAELSRVPKYRCFEIKSNLVNGLPLGYSEKSNDLDQ